MRDGHLYGADSKRNWVCFDWNTGETKYSESGVGKGSLTCADGTLYTFSESNRTVGLVKPIPEGHQVISQFQIPEGGKANPGLTRSCVADGCTSATEISYSLTMSGTKTEESMR